MSYFVNSQSIQRWAELVDARSRLPHVIRRLVWATIDRRHLDKVNFPAYESGQRPGFDGEVSCCEGNAWVPAGHSVWELSVETRPQSKASSDLDARTKATSAEDRRERTYVCLTGRRFRDKKKWEERQNRLGSWKAVKALDADDLEQWMEMAPAVACWFATEIGVQPAGVDDVTAKWNAIARATKRPLRPSLFLVGREASVKRLQGWLLGDASELVFESRSPAEVIDFACASLMTLPDDQRDAFLSRAVIVESMAAWTQLRSNPLPAILIVDPRVELSPEEVGRAITDGHHVLRAVEPGAIQGSADLQLERPGVFGIARELEKCDYPPVEAEQHAAACGGSLAILKSRLASYRSSHAPSWDKTVAPQTIASCLLLGGWNGSNSADQEVHEALTGRPYTQLEPEFQCLATCADPMLFHASGNWRVIAKDYAWGALGNSVASSTLKTWTELAATILADDDPGFSLPDNERWLAQVRGHVPRYSQTLKTHVAQAIAFLGAFGDKLEAARAIDVAHSIDRIVARVLAPTTSWHRWASLGPRLPLLAEASPTSFLRAVRDDLARPEPQLLRLFDDSDDSLFRGCNHAGLLWALETLAWSVDFLPETCRVLLRLTKNDPGGKWANRPGVSLRDIFSYWMPQTTATTDERIKLLDVLVADERQTAWGVLLSLLLQPVGGVAMLIHRPMWRDWGSSWRPGVTVAESLKFATAVGERVLGQASHEAARWKQVFQNIARFPDTVHAQLLAATSKLTASDLSDADRRVLADELSSQINCHRHHHDAEWALPPEILDALEASLDSLKPRSPVLRHAWLFEQWPNQFYDRSAGSHEDHERAVDRAREDALREIVAESGFEGVAALVANAGAPNVVGYSLATAFTDRYIDHVLPGQIAAGGNHLDFAGGFVWARHRSAGWPWADAAFGRCTTDDERAWFLVMLPFDKATWDRADSAGDIVRSLYWQRRRAWNHELDREELRRAVTSLVDFKRPGDAIVMCAMAIRCKKEVASQTLLLPLRALLQLEADAGTQQFHRAGNDIADVIETLQQRSDADESELIHVEWNYLALLSAHGRHSPKVLHRYLSRTPQFFIEVLSRCYRSRDEPIEESKARPLDERRTALATQALRLLRGWKLIPGRSSDGTVDETALRAWCDESRRLAKQCGRSEICDDQIGSLFAHAPADKDGSWPCGPVRRVAQSIGTSSLGSGLHCGICNSRGVVIRDSGGAQERELAAKYRTQAAVIRLETPFVADVLTSVAEFYEREAREWDERDRWEK